MCAIKNLSYDTASETVPTFMPAVIVNMCVLAIFCAILPTTVESLTHHVLSDPVKPPPPPPPANPPPPTRTCIVVSTAAKPEPEIRVCIANVDGRFAPSRGSP